MNATHQRHLAEYEKKIGVFALSEISYRIAKGDNLRQMASEYGLELCDLRYFQMIPEEVAIYTYEKQHAKHLRLVYSAVA
jgi:hypothetical protein